MITRVALALAALAATAHAGQRCKKPPPPERPLVFYADDADVHADGRWHRTPKKGDPEKTGKLSPKAFDRFVAYHRSGPSTTDTIACLDALIADERDAKACTARSR